MSYTEANYKTLLSVEEFRSDCAGCRIKSGNYLSHTSGCLGIRGGAQRYRRRVGRVTTSSRRCSKNPFRGNKREIKTKCLEIRRNRPNVHISGIPSQIEDIILDMVTDMNIILEKRRDRYNRKRIWAEIESGDIESDSE